MKKGKIRVAFKVPMTKIKCIWCGKPATRKTWREIDGTTGSSCECEKCIGLNTNYLINKYEKNKKNSTNKKMS